MATALRFNTPWLLFALPLAGVCMVALYRKFGGLANRGNDLLWERIRLQNGPVPVRMTPLIFGSTLLSHLCGASTGREGAAVQIGGGTAALAARIGNFPPTRQRTLLVTGVAAGFASIFGTPLAGAIFAIEVSTPKNLLWRELPWAIACAYLADWTAKMWGATHATYAFSAPDWTQFRQPASLIGLCASGFAFGIVGKLFVTLHHGIRNRFEKWNFPWWTPPFLGGCILLMFSQLTNTGDYLGLGTWSNRLGAVTIQSAFTESGAQTWSWLAKITTTALSLGSGYKGGEVTPLFFTGATFGNTLAVPLGLPVSLCAALGFVTVFAGAAHTPLTGAFLGAELFGWEQFPLFLGVSWLARLACGKAGIYSTQER